MTLDLYTILELCATCGLAFSFVGVFSLMLATRKARREYRGKGYLKPPSGKAWFRFLMFNHYDAFGNPGTRLLFSIAHFCLNAVLIVLLAMAILTSCALLLKYVGNGPSFPSRTLL